MTTDSTDPRGLAAYLEDKGAAMRAAAERRPAMDDWQETVSAECVADDLTGVRKLRIRDWTYLSDGGPDSGGWSLGPSSPELLCGVMSTCLTHTYLCLAAMRGMSLDRVAVRVTAENNDSRFFGVESDRPAVPYELTAYVDIRSAELTEGELAQFVLQGEQICPIGQLIRTPNTVRLVRGTIGG